MKKPSKPLYLRVTYNGRAEDYDSRDGLAGFESDCAEFFQSDRVSLIRLGWFRFEKGDSPDGRFIEVARKERTE